MFADPQTVTINSVAKTLAKVSSKDTSSVYMSPDGIWKLTISHTPSKDRIRSMVRLDNRAIVTNPLDSTDTDYDTLAFYAVIDRPLYGFALVDIERNVAGLLAWLTTGNVDKIYGLES